MYRARFFFQSLFSISVLGVLLLAPVAAVHAQSELPNTAVSTQVENTEPDGELADDTQSVLPLEDTSMVERAPQFYADSTLELADVYYGPVFAAGGQVNFSGEAYEDVVVAGGSVRIDGRVHQDIYAAGGTVTILGQVDGNIILAGGEVVFTETSQVNGSVISAGEKLGLSGSVLNMAYLGGSSVSLAGQIQGDVNVGAETVVLTETAFVGGTVVGVAGEPVNAAEGSDVTGGVDVMIEDRTKKDEAASVGAWVFKTLSNLVSYSLIALITILVFSKAFAAMASRFAETRATSIGVGALTFASLMFGSLLIFFTILGWKAGLMGFLALMGLFSFGWLVPAYEMGVRLGAKQGVWVQALVGGALTALIASVPFFGGLLMIGLSTYGVGVAIRALRND